MPQLLSVWVTVVVPLSPIVLIGFMVDPVIIVGIVVTSIDVVSEPSTVHLK